MKKQIFVIPFILLLYSYAAGADGVIGTVDSINNAKKEITVKINSGKSVKMGESLEVITDEGKIQLNVKYPMMTIALCKIQGKGKLSAIHKEMAVYSYGKSPDSSMSAASKTSGERLSDNGQGIVKDTTSGIMWLKDANPSRKSMTWEEAKAFIENLNAAGYSDWRLPTKEEFELLLKIGPDDIKKNFDNVCYFYWTSSEYSGSSGYVWVANIDEGSTDYNFKTNDNFIWAVRDGKGIANRRVRQSGDDDMVKPYAESICKKYNEEYVSYRTELDAITVSSYDVKCRKGNRESSYKLKYDKLLGSWSE